MYTYERGDNGRMTLRNEEPLNLYSSITLEAEFGGHVACMEEIREGYNTVLEIFKGILVCHVGDET
jgi:hypothetical protein